MWGSDKFGTTTADGKSIHVWRCKGQHAVNPYVTNHKGLQALIEAHAKWKTQYYPDSPWFFPGHDRDANGPVDKGALAHALILPRDSAALHRINRNRNFLSGVLAR